MGALFGPGNKIRATWVSFNNADPPTSLYFIPYGTATGYGYSNAPTVEVDILKRSDSTSQITPDTTVLNFNASDWNVPQTVTLNAPLDTTVDNGSTSFYVYSPNNPEYAYQTLTANEIGVGQFAIGGNAQALGTQYTLTVTEPIPPATTGRNTFTVALTGQPTSNVTVSIIKQDGGDADLTLNDTDPRTPGTQNTITFTPNNWNQPQTLTITAAADADSINGVAIFYVIAPGYINQAIAVSELDTTTPPNLVVTPAPTPATGPVIVSVSQGGTAPLKVHLPVAPTANETMTITEETQTGYDQFITATGTLTFTPTNYNTDQTITFNDAAADTSALNGVAVFYLDVPGYASQKVFVNEQAKTQSKDFTIGYPSGNVIVVPEGGTATFTVVLTANPGTDATVALTAEAGGDASLALNPTSLSFTADTTDPTTGKIIPGSGNWGKQQTVTVSAAVDADTIDGIAFFDVTAPGLATQTVTIIQNDNTPAQSIVISGASGNTVFVPEGTNAGPGTNTFNVALSAAPTANVIVTIGSQAAADGGDAELSTDLTRLTFTPANYAVPQTVTVSAAQDPAGSPDNWDETRLFYVSSPGLTTQVITAVNLDNNVPNINISGSSSKVVTVQDISVLEGDNVGQTFYVSLPFKPAYDVTVNIDEQAGGDASISLSQSSLTFTTSNWNTPQAVTATSTADFDATNGTANFYISAIGYDVQAVAITQIDVTASPVVVKTQTLSVPEGEFTLLGVTLNAQPVANVTVDVTQELGGDASLLVLDSASGTYQTTTSLTFTPSNWNTEQTLVFYSANDADTTNGTASYDLKSTAQNLSGTDFPFANYTTIDLTQIDKDAAPLVVSTDFVPVLSGSAGTFTVALPSQPSANVTVTISRQSDSDPNLVAILTTLTFTPSNWSSAGGEDIIRRQYKRHRRNRGIYRLGRRIPQPHCHRFRERIPARAPDPFGKQSVCAGDSPAGQRFPRKHQHHQCAGWPPPYRWTRTAISSSPGIP